MKIAIVGSRNITDKKYVFDLLDSLLPNELDTLVSGGAKGVDTLVEEYAKEKGLNFIVVLPEWDTYGKAADPIRNKKIVNGSDYVIAIHDGTSKGTLNTISIARHAEKLIAVDTNGLIQVFILNVGKDNEHKKFD